MIRMTPFESKEMVGSIGGARYMFSKFVHHQDMSTMKLPASIELYGEDEPPRHESKRRSLVWVRYLT